MYGMNLVKEPVTPVPVVLDLQVKLAFIFIKHLPPMYEGMGSVKPPVTPVPVVLDLQVKLAFNILNKITPMYEGMGPVKRLSHQYQLY